MEEYGISHIVYSQALLCFIHAPMYMYTIACHTCMCMQAQYDIVRRMHNCKILIIQAELCPIDA